MIFVMISQNLNKGKEKNGENLENFENTTFFCERCKRICLNEFPDFFIPDFGKVCKDCYTLVTSEIPSHFESYQSEFTEWLIENLFP